jgi:hypothetical protein
MVTTVAIAIFSDVEKRHATEVYSGTTNSGSNCMRSTWSKTSDNVPAYKTIQVLNCMTNVKLVFSRDHLSVSLSVMYGISLDKS